MTSGRIEKQVNLNSPNLLYLNLDPTPLVKRPSPAHPSCISPGLITGFLRFSYRNTNCQTAGTQVTKTPDQEL